MKMFNRPKKIKVLASGREGTSIYDEMVAVTPLPEFPQFPSPLDNVYINIADSEGAKEAYIKDVAKLAETADKAEHYRER